MLSFDKDATIKGFEVAGDIFKRFGSTRILALFFALGFLAVIAHIAPQAAEFCGGAGFVAFALTLLSLHRQPHGGRL